MSGEFEDRGEHCLECICNSPYKLVYMSGECENCGENCLDCLCAHKLVYRPPNIETMTDSQMEKYQLAKKLCSSWEVRIDDND
jgi:hypothetical protein